MTKFNTISSYDWSVAISKGREPNAVRVLLTTILLSPFCAHACDDLRFLSAIAQVESGNNAKSVSSSGCVSSYQITPQNWAMHTDWPLSDASDPTKAQVVAVRHLQWIRSELAKMPHVGEIDVPALALAWRYGPHGRGNKASAIDYVSRVKNILSTTPETK